jgi:NADPH:quinone reductase-like Zn-dependent oxidoreductase
MKAVQYARYGGPDVLEVREVPSTPVGPDGLRVTVLAAGIGGGETDIRAGRFRRVLRQKLPAGTGVDFAGLVAERGDEVDSVEVGDLVWGIVPRRTFGAIAEEVVVPAARVVATPAGIDPVDAAALPASGTTAVHALMDVVTVGKGSEILIRGATGGVGIVAVQVAAALGAHPKGFERCWQSLWPGARHIAGSTTRCRGSGATFFGLPWCANVHKIRTCFHR